MRYTDLPKMTDQLLFLLLTVSFASAAIIPENSPISFKNDSTSPTNNKKNYNVTEIVSPQGVNSIQKPTAALPRAPDTTTAGKRSVDEECNSDVQTSSMDLKIDGKNFRYIIIEEMINNSDFVNNNENDDQTKFVGNDNDKTVRQKYENVRESKRVRRQYRIYGMFGLPRDTYKPSSSSYQTTPVTTHIILLDNTPLENYEKYRYTIVKIENNNNNVIKDVTKTTTPKPTTTLRPFNKQREKDVMDPIQKYNQDNDPLNHDHEHFKRDTTERTERKNVNGIKFLVWGGELKNITDENATSGSECAPDVLDEKLFESTSFACLWMKNRFPNKNEYSIIGTGMPGPDQHIQELARELCSDHKESTSDDDIGSVKKTTNDCNIELRNLYYRIQTSVKKKAAPKVPSHNII